MHHLQLIIILCVPKYASIICIHTYETYIPDTYKALTKTLKKNKEFENHHTHEEKSGSSYKERNKKQFKHLIVFFNALYNMKKN